MKAIVISKYGEPDVLRIEDRPVPRATAGTVVIRVRAFGVNHAEMYFRSGMWGEVPKVTGIECVGEVHEPGSSALRAGQRVFALMGGMGRTIDGSYAEYVRAPETNVVAIDSTAEWTELAAIPESYATAWALLRQLGAGRGDAIVVRGGTSALGQAAINIARDLDLRVLATTRSRDKATIIESLGAEPLIDRPDLGGDVHARISAGVAGVIDLVGGTTSADSLKMVRDGGRVVMAGFLGGGGTRISIDMLSEMPSGAHLSFFGSFTFGTPLYPLDRIPFARIVERATRGIYRSSPAHVFAFDRIVDAHRLVESGAARGKIVVTV
jgi:NADPH:quinone reductase-like Zn-dependent oxidoreductase